MPQPDNVSTLPVATMPVAARAAAPALVLGNPARDERTMSGIETWLRMFAGVAWMGLCSFVFLFALLLFLPSRALRIKVGNVYGTVAGKGCTWLSGSSLRVTGREHADGARPAIYVANHASIIDIFLGIWLSPMGTCGVGKKEVIYYPFFGQFFWLAGHLRIDRGNNGKAVESLKYLASFVKQHGLSIFIWPEGTRSRDGRLRAFKKGAFHLALATGLPVVPMVIKGSHRAWETRSLRLHRANLEVEFLPAIDTSSWTRETLEAHMDELQAVFAAALPDDQRPLPTQQAAPQKLAA